MSVFWPSECLSSRGHKPLFVPFLLFSSNIFKNQKSKQKGEKEITSPILYDVILSSIELMRQPILYFTCFWILTNWKIIFDLRVYTHWAKIKIVMQKLDNALFYPLFILVLKIFEQANSLKFAKDKFCFWGKFYASSK